MSDHKRLIYAEDAIKELSEALAIVVKDNEKSAKFIIDRVPSVQPKQPTEVQDILQYLDEYLHPIISPEHWSVYSELYDMVSMLPSAQPQWIPYEDDTLPEIDEEICVIDIDDNVNWTHRTKYSDWLYDPFGNHLKNIVGWFPLPKMKKEYKWEQT